MANSRASADTRALTTNRRAQCYPAKHQSSDVVSDRATLCKRSLKMAVFSVPPRLRAAAALGQTADSNRWFTAHHVWQTAFGPMRIRSSRCGCCLDMGLVLPARNGQPRFLFSPASRTAVLYLEHAANAMHACTSIRRAPSDTTGEHVAKHNQRCLWGNIEDEILKIWARERFCNQSRELLHKESNTDSPAQTN